MSLDKINKKLKELGMTRQKDRDVIIQMVREFGQAVLEKNLPKW